ncbi:MAG: hypothetical protein GTO41_19950 [Burkholderiales bacterium]|nr:hypothetical protein [Burkholderiales bacterium]
MAVDLQELLLSSQALTLDQAGKNFVSHMDLQARIATNKFDEVDLLQAAAAKELGKMGAHTDPLLPRSS